MLVLQDGQLYVAAVTQSLGQPNTYNNFYYVLKNPVTLEEELLDDNGDPILDEEGNPSTEYVNSKLGMLQEPIEYLLSGGSKVIKVIDGVDHWLIKAPNNFTIDSELQPDSTAPVAEVWSVGGTEQSLSGTVDILPSLPLRTVSYANELGLGFEETLEDRLDAWKTKVLELLLEKFT